MYNLHRAGFWPFSSVFLSVFVVYNLSFSLQSFFTKCRPLRSGATLVSVLSLLAAPIKAYKSHSYALETTYAGDTFFDGFDFYAVCWIIPKNTSAHELRRLRRE